MEISFKRAIEIKNIRFAFGHDAVEKWIHNISCASLENPLLATLITLTAGTIFFSLMLILIVIFAGVICLISIILLIEGLILVTIIAAVCLVTMIGSYIYVVVITLDMYFKPEQKK